MPHASRFRRTNRRFDELRSIYRGSDGSVRDLSRFESRTRRRGGFFLAFFLLISAFVIGAVLAALFLFRSQERFTGEGVSVVVQAPEQTRSGDEMLYVITYKNEEPVILGNVELNVRYPDGFTMNETTPAASNTSGQERGGTWNIGTLPRGRDGKVEIRGKLVGTLNTQQTLQALLTYKPSTFNAEFQEVASATTTIATSVLDLTVTGPDIVVPESEVQYGISFMNTTDEALEHVEVGFEIPADFSIQSTKPERDGTLTRWLFPKITKGEKKEIVIRGAYSGEARDTRVVTARVGFRNGSQFVLQREEEHTTNVVKGDVTIGLAVNGSAANTPVQFGDLLKYTVSVKNRSDKPVEQLTVATTIQSKLIDWPSLKDAKKGTKNDATITWTKTQIPELRKLDPGKEVLIAFEVRARAATTTVPSNELLVESNAAVTITKTASSSKPIVVQSNTVTNAVNTNLAFRAEARYFTDDGSKIGEGPLPPKVGATTQYRVRWTVTNALHDVLSMKVSAPLPLDAAFVQSGHVSAGTLLYDPASRAVSWTLSRLPTTTPEATADFTVSVTPLEGHVGKVVPLLGVATLEARDRVTGGLLRASQSALDTNLDGDQYGQGKGVVQQ